MAKQHESQLRKTALASAITASIGIAATGIPGLAISDVYTWGTLGGPASNTTTCSISPNAATVIFTMIDPAGQAFANSSIPAKGNNQYQTPTCGTLTYDTDTESGSADIVAFDFFNGTLPAVAAGISIDKIPAGLDQGVGNLFLSNMLFDWNGTFGIPVSLVWDAQAVLNEMDGTPTTFTLNSDGTINTAGPLTGTGGTPASDGTYSSLIPSNGGYLLLGPSPLATLDFNTTNIVGTDVNGDPVCLPGADGNFTNNAGGGCMNVNPSADITASIITDTTPNVNRFDLSTPTTGDLLSPGIGGNPMQDGPFSGNHANFDYTSMALTSFSDTTAPGITLTDGNTVDLIVGDPAYNGSASTCTDAAPLSAFTYTAALDAASAALVPISTAAPSTTLLTYECTDDSGNTGTVIQTVNVKAPDAVITLLADGNGDVSPVTQECAVTYVDAGATCSDPEDGNIIGTGNPLPNNLFSLDQSNVDANIGIPGGPYTATWTCQDNDLNVSTQDRLVNVVDTTKPVITLQGNNPDNVVSSTPDNPATYTDPTADATDSCDSVLFPINFIATSGSVDMDVPDNGAETLSYTLSYSQTDTSGNNSIVSRDVNVTRSQPVITLVGGGEVLNIGDTYTEQGMDITDAQDGNLSGITASGTSIGLTYTIDSSSVDTSTSGNYSVTYNVVDSDGNIGTTVIRDVQVGIFATGSNFTMLEAAGNVFGGTNDVNFDWDQTTNNDEVDYTNDLNFNMNIASQAPWPFFGFVWTAHDTRVFGPGTYSFDSGCTVAELRATGCPAGSAANSGPPISMTVGPGQFGAHILFDWNTTIDIDVVNVWDVDAAWDQHGDTDPKNQLWNGATGAAPDPITDWKLVSTDINGDGINGSPMVDGPFQGFYANFNAGPGASAPPPEPYTGTAPDTKIGSGLFASPMNPWMLFTVLLSLLGLRRFSKKQ